MSDDQKIIDLSTTIATSAKVFIKKYLKTNGITSHDQIQDDDLRKVVDAYEALYNFGRKYGLDRCDLFV